MYPANQLIGEMNRIGVNFVVGDTIPRVATSLSPSELMAGLVAHKDARIRLALIPVLLQHPEYAPEAQNTLNLLDDSQKLNFKLYYTAAYLLQIVYSEELEGLLASFQKIQDNFSEELKVSGDGTALERLKQLAKRHKEITNLSVNWYGTYDHAAKRILARMRKEREWAKA